MGREERRCPCELGCEKKKKRGPTDDLSHGKRRPDEL
jgi:hypothetical protein